MEDIRYSEEVRLDTLEVRWGLSCIDNYEHRRAQEAVNKIHSDRLKLMRVGVVRLRRWQSERGLCDLHDDILEEMSEGEVYGHFV